MITYMGGLTNMDGGGDQNEKAVPEAVYLDTMRKDFILALYI